MSFLEAPTSIENVKKTETIFGNNFVTIGGEKLTYRLFSNLTLNKDSLVLEIGCKLGGTLSYLNDTYNCHCVGLDGNKIYIEHSKKCFDDVEKMNFIHADIEVYHLPKNHFDFIICRDFLINIKNKEALLEKFLRWLKPGGRIFLTVQCNGNQIDDNYSSYNLEKNLKPINLYTYVSYLDNLGFENIKIKDNSNLLINSLEEDLFIFEHNKTNFIEIFNEKEYEEKYEKLFNTKNWCINKNYLWGNINAYKPLNES